MANYDRLYPNGNFVSNVLSADISATVTTFTLDSVTGFPSSGRFIACWSPTNSAKREFVRGAISGSTFVGVTTNNPTTTTGTLIVAGSTTLSVASVTNFVANQMVKISESGDKEYNEVVSVGASSLTVLKPLKKAWSATAAVEGFSDRGLDEGGAVAHKKGEKLVFPTSEYDLQMLQDATERIGEVAISNTVNASTTVRGVIEEATVAEQGTATATGSTGARLVPAVANLVKTSAGAGDENKLAVLDAAGDFAEGFIPHTLATALTLNGGATSSGAVTLTGLSKLQRTFSDWVTATDAATVTFNLSSGNKQRVTLGGNRTLAVSNLTVGQGIYIRLLQDGTGSRTVTWFSGSETFLPAAVDAATDIITVTTDTPTTTPVRFTNSGGALPAGLSAGTTYYVINQSATTLKVATTLANANAGTAVNITGAGTGTHTIEYWIRWDGDTIPTLTTTKNRGDTFLIEAYATNLFIGHIIGQNN